MTEPARIAEMTSGAAPWRLWGSYLSERAWGTVREDYSADGDAWRYFPYEHSPSRAYRWSEDGLLGICDESQRLCFALALWNGNDTMLKERAFGLNGHEGNHAEDAKDYWFYLDNTPSHSYMKALYKYPHARFPYDELREESRRRDRIDPEYELIDTGVFADQRYFDVTVEYAKGSPTDILIRITIANRGPDAATIDLLTDGRLELGIGVGWPAGSDFAGDYDQAGIRVGTPGVRVQRLGEALHIIRAFLTDEQPVEFQGTQFQAAGLHQMPGLDART